MPGLSRVGVVWDSSVGEVQFRATAAARAARVTLQSLPIQGAEDFTGAFGRGSRERLNGVIVLSSPLILNKRPEIATLA